MNGSIRFFKRFSLGKNLWAYFTKSGPGLSLRILPGVSIGFSLSRGFHFSAGALGTGLSYRGYSKR